MKNWLIYLMLCAAAVSCDGPDGEVDEIRSSYFVQGYFELEEIEPYLHTDNTIWLYEQYYHQSQLPVWYNLYKNRTKFLELSKKHGDRNFNRLILDDMLPKNAYFANDFAEIMITSDTDFDATHTAGTSLNDYVRLITVTPIKFIQSGYKEKSKWSRLELRIFQNYFRSTMKQDYYYSSSSVTLGYQHIFPVYKLVSELEPDDMAVWGRGAITPNQYIGSTDPFAIFEFVQSPESPGVHNIRIALTTDTGKAFYINPIRIAFE